MTIISSNSILNSTFGSSRNIGRTSSDFNKANAELHNEDQYATRADLVKSGLSGVYDDTRQTMLNAYGNNLAIQGSTLKLHHEQQAIDVLNSIMNEFKPNNIQDGGPTKTEQADSALEQIENLLRRTDGSGRYIFGGKQAYVDPLSKIDPATGKRVQVHLKTETNLVNGEVTNNYSPDIDRNDTRIAVSDIHNVRESFLYASMPEIANSIGYLNQVKVVDAATLAVPATPAANLLIATNKLTLLETKEKSGRRDLEYLIDIEQEQIKSAGEIYKADLKTAEAVISDLFKKDLVKESQRVGFLLKSLMAQISASQLGDNIFTQLVNRTNI